MFGPYSIAWLRPFRSKFLFLLTLRTKPNPSSGDLNVIRQGVRLLVCRCRSGVKKRGRCCWRQRGGTNPARAADLTFVRSRRLLATLCMQSDARIPRWTFVTRNNARHVVRIPFSVSCCRSYVILVFPLSNKNMEFRGLMSFHKNSTKVFMIPIFHITTIPSPTSKSHQY